MLKYCVDNIDIFETEECGDDHDSVLIVLRCSSKYVLARNKKRGGLEFPGGHRDGEEAIEEAAGRDSLEDGGYNHKKH